MEHNQTLVTFPAMTIDEYNETIAKLNNFGYIFVQLDTRTKYENFITGPEEIKDIVKEHIDPELLKLKKDFDKLIQTEEKNKRLFQDNKILSEENDKLIGELNELRCFKHEHETFGKNIIELTEKYITVKNFNKEIMSINFRKTEVLKNKDLFIETLQERVSNLEKSLSSLKEENKNKKKCSKSYCKKLHKDAMNLELYKDKCTALEEKIEILEQIIKDKNNE